MVRKLFQWYWLQGGQNSRLMRPVLVLAGIFKELEFPNQNGLKFWVRQITQVSNKEELLPRCSPRRMGMARERVREIVAWEN